MELSFSTEEKQFIKEASTYREFANRNKGNIPEYSTSKSVMYLNDASKWLISTAAEAAVVKAAGLDLTNQPLDVWPAFYLPRHKKLYDTRGDLNLPDRVFEIRRVKFAEQDLCIRSKDVRHNAINVKVYVAHEYDTATGQITWMTDEPEITGWIDAKEGWERGFKPNWGRGLEHDARVVPHEWVNHDFAGALL